jgi:hypothetical protein
LGKGLPESLLDGSSRNGDSMTLCPLGIDIANALLNLEEGINSIEKDNLGAVGHG